MYAALRTRTVLRAPAVVRGFAASSRARETFRQDLDADKKLRKDLKDDDRKVSEELNKASAAGMEKIGEAADAATKKAGEIADKLKGVLGANAPTKDQVVEEIAEAQEAANFTLGQEAGAADKLNDAVHKEEWKENKKL